VNIMSASVPPVSPRVLLATIRGLNSHAAWCSNYEFEDVISRVDDVDRIVLRPGTRQPLRQRVVRSLASRHLHPRLSRLNPGVVPETVTRDYDLFVFVCMNPWDLLYLNGVRGWRERCRYKVCYMVEFWAGQASGGQYDDLVGLAADFDQVALCFSGSVEAVAKMSGRPVRHVPLASDVERFTPYPTAPARVIDVLSIGRRAEPVHDALRARAAERPFFYHFDTLPGPLVRPSHPAQHREVLAQSAKRSHCFVTYPAKFGVDDERLGQSEVGARYYEGAAAGALLLGQAPTNPSFSADFPWPDAVVSLREDGSDVGEVLNALWAAPDRMEAASRRNAAHALRRHDWGHRWQELLRMASLDPRPALTDRLGRLEALAFGAETDGLATLSAASHSSERRH
jgi:hypothetical protein